MMFVGSSYCTGVPLPCVAFVVPRVACLCLSSVPRLDVLKARFAFRRIDHRVLDKSAPADRFMALELTPTDPGLAEHVQRVRVLLDVAGAYIIKAEVTDSDGDRTVLSSSAVAPTIR